MVTQFQRTLTTTVNDIEHIEATNYSGISIVKIFFQPGADVRTANAQVTSVSQTLLKQMPPGSTPPLILLYNASTVPIIQLALSGKGLPEQALFDLGLNFVRVPLSPYRARRCRIRSAANSGRSRSTSILTRCAHAAFPLRTSLRHLPSRT